MDVTFWGVRGSIPAPGPGTLRYGGNTACVSVRLDDGSLVIFDCGTGARNLGNALMTGAFGHGHGQATLFLSLPQWDHIQGFPFFRPFYVPGNQFTIYGSNANPGDLQSVLEFQMAAQYFPVQTLKNMAASLTVCSLADGGEVTVGTARVRAVRSRPGPLGALAFRLEQGDRALVYAGHAGYADQGPSPATLALYAGADLLIHECSLSAEDSPRYRQRGLASLDQALDSAVAAQVKRLALFHYDQDYTDQKIDTLLAQARTNLQTRRTTIDPIAAAETLTIGV